MLFKQAAVFNFKSYFITRIARKQCMSAHTHKRELTLLNRTQVMISYLSQPVTFPWIFSFSLKIGTHMNSLLLPI